MQTKLGALSKIKKDILENQNYIVTYCRNEEIISTKISFGNQDGWCCLTGLRTYSRTNQSFSPCMQNVEY